MILANFPNFCEAEVILKPAWQMTKLSSARAKATSQHHFGVPGFLQVVEWESGVANTTRSSVYLTIFVVCTYKVHRTQHELTKGWRLCSKASSLDPLYQNVPQFWIESVMPSMVISHGGLFLVETPRRSVVFLPKAVLMGQGHNNKNHRKASHLDRIQTSQGHIG